jgi:hypothetical protein
VGVVYVLVAPGGEDEKSEDQKNEDQKDPAQKSESARAPADPGRKKAAAHGARIQALLAPAGGGAASHRRPAHADGFVIRF